MSADLPRKAISLTGAGWAVLDDDLNVRPGRWATFEDAEDYGLSGKYLLLGNWVVEVNSLDGIVTEDVTYPLRKTIESEILDKIIRQFEEEEAGVEVALGGADYVISVLREFKNRED